MKLFPNCRTSLLAIPALLIATPAWAHHVMGGRLPSTFLEGLLSGLGHPVLGPEHLRFLIAVAGFFHGYAFGESIYGAETAPLAAYLIGLVAVQSALAVGIALFVRRVGGRVSAPIPRLAGAAVFGMGFAVLIGQLVPAV